MCLEKAKAVILEEDKVVYKAFIKKPDGTLMTLYQGKVYELSNEPVHDKLEDDGKNNSKKFHINGHTAMGYERDSGYVVYAGMFHSFEKLDDAKFIVKTNNMKYFYGMDVESVVVKCIIPKDSKLVMKGQFYITYPATAYASSDIIFKEIVGVG